MAARLTRAGGGRQTRGVRLEPVRENVLRVTATRQELAVIVAAARMALEAMRQDPDAPREAVGLLGRVLADYDAAAADQDAAGASGPPM
jgi:hypothetical protein